MRRYIKNADVLLEGKIQKADLLFDETQILACGTPSEVEAWLKADREAARNPVEEEMVITDASGLTILPGLVDTHVHLREPGYEEKETIATGTAAAAHGGFTTIFAMPNLKPFPSTPQTMKPYLERIEKDACIRVHPFGTITDNEAGVCPTDYEALRQLGIVWFSDDGVGVQSSAVMEEAMKRAVQADVLFSCHTEDMNYRAPGASVHQSKALKSTGWGGIPSACESEQLLRDLQLARKTGVRYHADHISAKESVEGLAKAKAAGADVSAEVTAHHLLLCDEDVKGPNWKMNPPLRSKEDREALIAGLESGALDFIANDHAPHTAAEKMRSMDKAPFGIVSLETAFPLLYTEFVSRQKRWSLEQLAAWMSEKPARRFGLTKAGVIQPGAYPDFVIVDLHRTDIIDPAAFLSRGKNTPFAGWQTDCKIVETICKGKTVWKED